MTVYVLCIIILIVIINKVADIATLAMVNFKSLSNRKIKLVYVKIILTNNSHYDIMKLNQREVGVVM